MYAGMACVLFPWGERAMSGDGLGVEQTQDKWVRVGLRGLTYGGGQRRQHKNDVVEGFSQRYGIHNLVWYEVHPNMQSAIMREKQLKKGSRQRKIDLTVEMNPQWRDLYAEIISYGSCPNNPLSLEETCFTDRCSLHRRWIAASQCYSR